MADVLFVWTAAYQTCLMGASVPRLLSGLYRLFHLCLIKHVLNVWPLTSTLACLVTRQYLMMFGRQTFIVCPGPYLKIEAMIIKSRLNGFRGIRVSDDEKKMFKSHIQDIFRDKVTIQTHY